VWSEHGARVRAQRMVRGQGFDLEHVQCDTCEKAALQRGCYGHHVDQSAASRVDENRSLLHQGKHFIADKVVIVWRERCVQRYEVGRLQSLRQGGGSPHSFKIPFAYERVVCGYGQAKSERAVRDTASDSTDAD
jgi:hypothetical protein